MKCRLVTPPTLEPITLAELKMHLRMDSGSIADRIDETQSIAPGLKAFIDDWTTHAGAGVDVFGYAAIVSFASGANTGLGTVDVKIQDSDDNLTFADWGTAFTQVTTLGLETTAALTIGTTLTNVAHGSFTYFVAGTVYSKSASVAGVSTGASTIPQSKYGAVAFDIGVDGTIDAIPATGNAAGYDTAALAIAGIPAAAAGHVRMGAVTAMRSTGTFVFGTTHLNAANTTVAYAQGTLTVNYNATYEKAYTGGKRYIRTVAKVLVADCSFGTTVIRWGAAGYEDDLLNSLITTAREYVEDVTRRKILTQIWDYILDGWPDGNAIKLPFGNLQSDTKATGTIVSSGAIPTQNETVTIGEKTYTFRNNPTGEGHVLIGADAAGSLDNLKSAINHTGTPGVDYVCAVAHPTILATTNTDISQALEAIIGGVTGNLIALTTTAASYTPSGATLTGGITSGEIKYYDSDGLAMTLVITEDYQAEFNGEECGRLVLPYGGSWPSGTLFPSNPIVIRFICGWATPALVPDKIKTAIKKVAAKLYESRGEDVLGQTVSEDKFLDRLLASARLWDFIA